MQQFLWVIYPYLALSLMIWGSLWRYDLDPLGWGSRSSEVLEKRWLKWGSLLFHWGIILVFFGHVAGILVPKAVWSAMGVSREFYHENADIAGGITGLMAWIGIGILILRRWRFPRLRINSRVMMDWAALALLFIVISLGLSITLIYNNVVGAYGYRSTVGPWIRGLLALHPHAGLMAGVPILIKIHILAAFALFAISPFTRLVHIWSLPLAYLRRAPIQYRSRTQYRRR